MSLAVASRFGRALADLTMRPGSELDPRAAAGQLEAFGSALAVSRELREVLLSPAVPPLRKRALVTRLGQVLGISPMVRNFLCVVIDHRRIRLLPEIRQAFQSQVDERLGIARADVASARVLSDQQRTSLVAQLARLTRRQVQARFSVEEDLIGGVLARVGSTVYDGSLRGRLEGLRRKLVSEEEVGSR